ncbi:MAG: type II toxin-antitoxin system death-on-curing family toxin [Alphaproteobacteria bacterium CG11_big_fil_rev_8_21_14_0_20_39_49]|nr:MAG: type II toxin-antitoxin system death-on-curing family toxin [Alphaproteobacteria bacterium CG11_big_fil_rev_8_21_14_0_20_39_49]
MNKVAEPRWISKGQALYVHEQSIARHGGGAGIRDEGLLESALARAENIYAYGEADICMLAAAYAEGIARNHSFVDGNKRTAYAVAGLFLRFNGLTLKIPNVSTQIKLFEDVAAGNVSKEALAEFYRQNTHSLNKG